jgi:eukaryotic-like serine/threonine-protein kinase
MSDADNKRIGDYEILKELGAGGMGKVYQVRNVITDRIEAMKVLLPDLASTPDLAARFLREVKLTASLDHPNICALRTAFSNDNRLYMVMEYVEGTTMATKLDMGPLTVNEAVKYISQVLSAVSYAHHLHIIHRDIKPANMMLTSQGVIKLMDFGIARSGDEKGLTMTGTTLGSIGYMSPEQVKGDPTDGRSDLYSVGIVLYEFVTGRRPFVANSEYSIMAAHLNQTPKPPLELNPGLPAALNEIILMAIAKEPAKRFQTADAFANALSTVPASSAVAPTVPRTPIGGATSGSGERPAGFWEASPTMERPSGPRTPVPPGAPIAATMPMGTPGSDTTIPLGTPAVATASSVGIPGTAAQAGAPVFSPVAAPAQATPVPVMPPPQGSGHRGLYMTLGALIVLAVLVVAGIYVPRISKTNAKAPDAATETASKVAPEPTEPPPSDTSTSGATTPGSPTQPAAAPVAKPASPVATTASVDNNSMAMKAAPTPSMAAQASNDLTPAEPGPSATDEGRRRHGMTPGVRCTRCKRALMAQNNGMQNDAAASGDSGAADAANGPADLNQLETEVDQLSNRAAAVNSSLDHLQQQQAAAGFGLRGDMVARQASMKTNLSKAEDAVQQKDAARAKRYVDLTGKDVEALERFLGR